MRCNLDTYGLAPLTFPVLVLAVMVQGVRGPRKFGIAEATLVAQDRVYLERMRLKKKGEPVDGA